MFNGTSYEEHSLDFVKQRASSFIDVDLNEDEKDFLWLVREGNVDELRTFLRTKKDVDSDCCDYRGHRALDLAVSRRDLTILELLLRELKVTPVHFYCAILRAVFERNADILEMVLDKAEDDSKLLDSLSDLMMGGPECTNCLPEVAATNLTPTMAAAINNDIECTRILLERGYHVQKPHTTKCHCQEYCAKRSLGYETLNQSISRMNAFKALASPCYLILTSEDPILSAFQLGRELAFLAKELPENQKEYTSLVKQCSTFAADLLNECRNTEEVQAVLVQKNGFLDGRPHRFSRLHLAIQCEQKEFVAHPSCQQVLRSMWVEGLGGWYGLSFRWRLFHVLKHVVLTPFVSLAYIFIPKTKLLKPLQVPLNRFIYSVTSYLCFLVLLMVTLLNDRRYDTDTPVTWTEASVCCFVVGHSWEVILNLFSMGIDNFFRSWWSVFDLVMFSLFLVTDFLWFSVFLYSLIMHLGEEGVGGSNRMTWSSYHPILLGEGLYATASVMAFSRLLLYCHVHSKLGPLGTSVKKMLGDVSRFFILFFVIMFAFATGINSIYKNYKNSVRIISGTSEEQSDAFLTLRNTFKSLFWAIFGMGEPDFAHIVVAGNFTDEASEGSSNHAFTENVGYGLWGLYHMVTVIVLLNMLIAMMTDSYVKVQRNSDLEWKFACSTLWLTIFDSHNIVPVPFNLIPSMHRIAIICQCLIHKVRGTHEENDGNFSWSMARCCYWDPHVDNYVRKAAEEKYEKLMVQLIRRYLNCRKLRETTAWNKFCVAELKEKLKFEILQELGHHRPHNYIQNRTASRRRTRKGSLYPTIYLPKNTEL